MHEDKKINENNWDYSVEDNLPIIATTGLTIKPTKAKTIGPNVPRPTKLTRIFVTKPPKGTWPSKSKNRQTMRWPKALKVQINGGDNMAKNKLKHDTNNILIGNNNNISNVPMAPWNHKKEK